MIAIPLVTLIHISLNKYRPDVHNISTIIDDVIPFKAVFSLPYMYWFAFLSVVLLYFAIVDAKNYFRLLASVITGMCICFIIFYLFPTTVPRPNVVGNDVLSRLVRYIYSTDNPYNCFPSIHVLDAFLPALFLCKFNKNMIVKVVAVVSFVAITLSTVFIKQHYVLDAAASIVLGASMYLLFSNDYLWNKMPIQRVVDFLIPAKLKDNSADIE